MSKAARRISTEFYRPDDRRAPERDESLRAWLERQHAPEKVTVIERVIGGSIVYECRTNAAIFARLNRRRDRWAR